jgi:hypothetical protein
LTKFDGISSSEAQNHVEVMKSKFGILEYQFYNAFSQYSGPPEGYEHKDNWEQAVLQTHIQKNILNAYVQKINQHPRGRSWLIVNAMAWDPGVPFPPDFVAHGVHTILSISVNYPLEAHKPSNATNQANATLLQVIEPSPAVATVIARKWGKFAKHMGFDGILWSMMKLPASGSTVERCPGDWHGFLATAKQELMKPDIRLLQNAEFVDGCHSPASAYMDVVDYPVWVQWEQSIWTNWEGRSQITTQHGGVITSLLKEWSPDYKADPKENVVDEIINRMHKAQCNNVAYNVIVDGPRHMVSDYYSQSAELSEAEIEKLQSAIQHPNPLCPASKKYQEAIDLPGIAITELQCAPVPFSPFPHPGPNAQVSATSWLLDKIKLHFQEVNNGLGNMQIDLFQGVPATPTDAGPKTSVRFTGNETEIMHIKLLSLHDGPFELQLAPSLTATCELVHEAIKHAHEDCWSHCGSKEGFCEWCGMNNACCNGVDEKNPVCQFSELEFNGHNAECTHVAAKGQETQAPAPAPAPVPAPVPVPTPLPSPAPPPTQPVAGFGVHRGMAAAGDVMEELGVTTLAACGADCLEDGACVAFEFDKSESSCALLSTFVQGDASEHSDVYIKAYKIELEGGVGASESDKFWLTAHLDADPESAVILSKTRLTTEDDFESEELSQMWAIVPGGEHWYHIEAAGVADGDSKMLSTTWDGNRVGLWNTDDKTKRQRWKIIKGSGDWYHIENEASISGGRHLLSAVTDGSKVDLWGTDDGSERQRWKIPGFKAALAFSGSMTVQNINFAAVQGKPHLQEEFETKVHDVIAAAGGMECTSGSGHHCEEISVVLSSGSVHVQYSVQSSSSKTGREVASLTKATNDGSLGRNLLDAIGTIHSIDTVETGPVAVTNLAPPHVVEEVITTRAPPTQAPIPPTTPQQEIFEEASPDMQSYVFLIAGVGCVVVVLLICCAGCLSKKRTAPYYGQDDFLSQIPEPAMGDVGLDDPSAPMMQDIRPRYAGTYP